MGILSFYFFTKKNEQQKEDVEKQIIQSYSIFSSYIPIKPDYVVYKTQIRKRKISGFKDNKIKNKNHLDIELSDKSENYEILIYDGKYSYGFSFHIELKIFKKYDSNYYQFYKDMINNFNYSYFANADYDDTYNMLRNNHYKEFEFLGRGSSFNGFLWLTYLSPQELALNGGNRLFELPYATKIEALNGGILIQINDTPEDCLTEEGQERLYKATEWVYNLIKTKEEV